MARRLVILFAVTSLFLPFIIHAAEGLPRVGLHSQSRYVRIWEDDIGMPHVVASSTDGVFWGFGYCVARDRMFQLELLRRSVEGTLAEILGEPFIEPDFLARRDGVSQHELLDGLHTAPEKFRSCLNSFSGGINAAIADVNAGHLSIDPAFAKVGIKPSFFTPLQILNIFAGTMAARYNDFTQELDNLHLLSEMVRKFGPRKASLILEDVIFYSDKGVYSTIQNGESKLPSSMRQIPSLSQPGHMTNPLHSPTLRLRKRNEILKTIGIPEKSGSYAAVFSNRNRGKKEAFLLGGPQMGYFKPSALYGIGLHTPDFDLVGTTPVGYIMLLFGANREIGFTATAGVANLVDLVSLEPDSQNPYLLRGKTGSWPSWKRVERIFVKGQKQALIREVEETALGPVVADEKGTRYVKVRGWRNRVVDSYVGWFESNFAKDLSEWMTASDKMALSINWLGLDRSGQIGYVYCGVGKSRKSFGDDRLPCDQPTFFKYPDIRISDMNSASGYYTNWNSPPYSNFRDGDLQTAWGKDQRTAFIAHEINKHQGDWTVSFIRALEQKIAFTDLRAWFYKDFLLKFVQSSELTAPGKKALAAITSWDGLRRDDNRDKLFDHPGAGAFDLWWQNVFVGLFGETLGDFAWMVGSDPTRTQSAILEKALQCDTRYEYLKGTTPEAFVTKCLNKMAADLVDKKGDISLQPCPPMEFLGINHVGAPTQTEPSSCQPFMNRGSDVQIMALSPDRIEIWGIMPPGNASFGKHATDQMDDFQNLSYRMRPIFRDDVRKLRGGFKVLDPQQER